MSGGGTTVQAPPVDPAQQALEKAQASALTQETGLISQQSNVENLLAPYLYQNMGLTPQYTNGQISGFTQNPQVAQNVATQNTVEGQLLTQEQGALSGTLPVNPTVTNSLSQSQNSLQDMLTASLGPNYAASTAGQSALNSFAASKAGVIFGANTGQMTLDEQLAAASGLSGVQTGGGTNSNAANVWGLPSTSIGQLSSLAQGYGQAQQPYELQSQEQLQAAQQSALLQQGTFGSILSSAGSLGGSLLSAAGPFGAFGGAGAFTF